MQNIQRLIEEHRQIDDLALGLVEIVQSPQPAPMEAFSTLRKLSACLDEHAASEEGFLYSDHMTVNAGQLEKEIEAFERAFQDLTEEWSIYVREWTPDNIEIDWHNFSHATQWVMERLRERIALENEILYPLALRHGRIKLRDSASEPRAGFNANKACH